MGLLISFGCAFSILSSPCYALSKQSDARFTSTEFHKNVFNVPSDDFWYPPYMIGKWKVSMKFKGASFTDSIPIETLSKNDNIPGFSKYSVVFAPDVGKDVDDMELRYVQIDSHPREDHPRNIRNILPKFIPDAVVDEAPYEFRKSPDWFHAPANRWKIKYHDDNGKGVIDLYTYKRKIDVFAGTVESTEFFKQVRYLNPSYTISLS
jgi:hypothetical protein